MKRRHNSENFRSQAMSFANISRRVATALRNDRVVPRGRLPRNRKPSLESLESRQLLAVTASLTSNNILQVTGTGNVSIQVQQLNYDVIQIVQTSGGKGTLIPIVPAGGQ